MVDEEPRVAQRGKYTITEASRRLGVHRNTLARYLKEGKIRCRFSKETNRKYFSGDDLVRLWRAL